MGKILKPNVICYECYDITYDYGNMNKCVQICCTHMYIRVYKYNTYVNDIQTESSIEKFCVLKFPLRIENNSKHFRQQNICVNL